VSKIVQFKQTFQLHTAMLSFIIKCTRWRRQIDGDFTARCTGNFWPKKINTKENATQLKQQVWRAKICRRVFKTAENILAEESHTLLCIADKRHFKHADRIRQFTNVQRFFPYYSANSTWLVTSRHVSQCEHLFIAL